MTTCATLFTGGGLFDVGARAAGYTHLWGVERDAEIADVARANGFAVTVADVLDCDPHDFAIPTLLHASPPCPNFSQAKAHGVETPLDTALGEKVGEFIRVLRPHLVTIENVWGYRGSRAFAAILRALDESGYLYDVAHVDASDYGVPQSRKRLWLRAVRGGLVPYLPPKVRPKVGWYAAIEDLLNDLPESRFANWQLARLPKEFAGEFFVVPQQSDDKKGTETGYGCPRRSPNEPALTITAHQNAAWYKAFILSGGGNTNMDETVEASMSKTRERAWLSSGRVVSMTPRALARFQSVPDSYALPGSRALACRVIGNGCPPKLVEALLRELSQRPPARAAASRTRPGPITSRTILRSAARPMPWRWATGIRRPCRSAGG